MPAARVSHRPSVRGDITGAQARERRFGRTQRYQSYVSSTAGCSDETETAACGVCSKCPTSFRGRRVLTGVARRAGPILSEESGSACATSMDWTLVADPWIVFPPLTGIFPGVDGNQQSYLTLGKGFLLSDTRSARGWG